MYSDICSRYCILPSLAVFHRNRVAVSAAPNAGAEDDDDAPEEDAVDSDDESRLFSRYQMDRRKKKEKKLRKMLGGDVEVIMVRIVCTLLT